MEELILERGRSERNYWRDLWRYRELFLFLTWRDILVRYKQTVIGVSWAVIRPLITMVAFTLIFGKLAGLSAPGGVPYALLVFAAMLPWQLFSNALGESSGSLVGNANLISKVYFPRLVVPASAVVTSLVDFAITVCLMAVMMAWYGFVPDLRVFALPLFVLLALGLALGAGLWLCALTVKYRDFRYVIPFLLQIGLYVSPVGFSSQIVPEKWRTLYALNPMVGVIDGFRWSLLRGETPLPLVSIACALLVTMLLLVTGVAYFRRMEKTFADII